MCLQNLCQYCATEIICTHNTGSRYVYKYLLILNDIRDTALFNNNRRMSKFSVREISKAKTKYCDKKDDYGKNDFPAVYAALR